MLLLQTFIYILYDSLVSAQSEVADVRKFLGGDIQVDYWFPLIKWHMGSSRISSPCDLNCNNFDAIFTSPCRWSNEWTVCGSGDELDWVRMHNSWGQDQGLTIFGTEERPDGYFLLTGTQKTMHPEHSAMLVSDQIECQEGDGYLSFRYWTSPGVKLRTCIRRPGLGKAYEWCSSDVTTGDPGPALFNIPGSIMYPFELVIEARGFNYDAFGFQGGAIAIDDVTYNASAVFNCKNIPHFDPLPELTVKTCETLQCSFDSGACLDVMAGTGWRVSEEKVGPYHTGIRHPLEGKFAYARGPGTKTLIFGQFHIVRRAEIEFCFYVATHEVRLSVYVTELDCEQRKKVFESEEISRQPHHWICDRFSIEPGKYESLEFAAERMTSAFAYVGLDQIGVVDPMRGINMCAQQLAGSARYRRSIGDSFSTCG